MQKLSLMQAVCAGYLLLAALTAAPVRAETVNLTSATVYHTVVFWLKPNTPANKVNEIKASVKSMEQLPMVEQVLVGTPIMSHRDVVDDSFSIAFTMTFKNEAALSAYNTDPHHKKISSEVTLPHVVRGLIYDYKAQ